MPPAAASPADKPAGKEAASEQTPTEAPIVEIPKDKQQLIGVKTVTAEVLPLTKNIRTVGLVEYDQRRLNTINTKLEGWIEKLYVNFTGTYVKKGDPIADIYSPELWATQQEFINVVRWAKAARTRSEGRAVPMSGQDEPNIGSMIDKDALSLVDAARQRLKLWDISDSQIRKIEESEKPIRTLTVYSPYSGYVLQKYVNQGQRIMPGEKLFDIADLSSVWITADIYEFELPLVKVGDPAIVQLAISRKAVLDAHRLYLPSPRRRDAHRQGAVQHPESGGPPKTTDVHERGVDHRLAAGSRCPRTQSSTPGCDGSHTWTKATAISSRGMS